MIVLFDNFWRSAYLVYFRLKCLLQKRIAVAALKSSILVVNTGVLSAPTVIGKSMGTVEQSGRDKETSISYTRASVVTVQKKRT